MYVVCLLFYAIGGILFVSVVVFIAPMRSILSRIYRLGEETSYCIYYKILNPLIFSGIKTNTPTWFFLPFLCL